MDIVSVKTTVTKIYLSFINKTNSNEKETLYIRCLRPYF